MPNSSANQLIPGYVSPLTDKEHAQIGRIAILWGQVEHFVDDLLPWVTGLKTEQLDAIDIFGKPIAAKVALLKASKERVEDDTNQRRVSDFCKLIDDTKVARNHLFHGMWGWRANSKNQTVEACARHRKFPSRPLKVTDLNRLEESLCRCSRLGYDAVNEFYGWQEEGIARFFHGNQKGAGFPEWLSQWTKRNRLDHLTLDQNAKAGQLPRPNALVPRK